MPQVGSHVSKFPNKEHDTNNVRSVIFQEVAGLDARYFYYAFRGLHCQGILPDVKVELQYSSLFAPHWCTQKAFAPSRCWHNPGMAVPARICLKWSTVGQEQRRAAAFRGLGAPRCRADSPAVPTSIAPSSIRRQLPQVSPKLVQPNPRFSGGRSSPAGCLPSQRSDRQIWTR